MTETARPRLSESDNRYFIVVAVALAAAVFVITWYSISVSRRDSLRLLEEQGRAFTESLALASQNALTSESYYNELVHLRYADLTRTLQKRKLERLSEQDWVSFALSHDLLGAYLFDSTAQMVLGVAARGAVENLPDFVAAEVANLLQNPESNYLLLDDTEENPARRIHYYLELTTQMDHVIVLVVDALYYNQALEQTGIGRLVREMGGEPGIEYIIYQTRDGLVFASRKFSELPSIDSDPFLTAALDSDSIQTRLHAFAGKRVLELVRPFSSDRFQFGLFRVGLSLEGYYAVSRGFDWQMIILSATLFVMLAIGMLYIGSRRRRLEISRRFEHMKSMTDHIFDRMRIGVAAVDTGGVLRLANRQFDITFNVSQVVGKPLAEVLPEQRELIEKFARESATTMEVEIETTIKNERKMLLIALSKVEGDGTMGASVVMVVYDVTKFRDYQRQATRRERLSELGDLAAGVAHEIRNPLNTISIAAQRLEAEFSPTENAEQYRSISGQIRSETRRLNEIITRFLALAREERKKYQPVRLDRLLAEAAELLQMEGEKIGLKVDITSEPELIVNGEPDRLKEIFLNLFNNTKEALNGRAGEFVVKAARRGNTVRVEVSDNGPGIPRELHDKIFTPYYTTKEAGTGLGLATVQRIVAALGGDITIDPAVSTGVRFIVTLPLKS